jgi:two-component system NtrC family sensor kinase
MTPSSAWPSLSGKITLGYYLLAAVIVLAAGLSYSELTTLESRVRLGDSTNALLDATLEIRRFERNYFLHRQTEDLEENRAAVERVRQSVQDGRERFLEVTTAATLTQLQERLDEYERHMATYAMAAPRARNAPEDGGEQRVRAAGKEIVAIASVMASAERDMLGRTLETFRRVLLWSIVILAVLVVFLSRVVSRRILRPLQALESGVIAVSAGSAGLLKALTADREVVSITSSVNAMLHDLELRQRHLLRAEKLASMGTMLSGVAHELNNPLSNLSTSCQILQEEWRELDDAARDRYLAQIDGQCERARHIVGALLDFARQRPSASEPVSLQPLVIQTFDFLRGEISPLISLTSAVPEGLVVAGNAPRLQQALLNLVRNAADAIGDRGEVRVSAGRVLVQVPQSSNEMFADCGLRGEVAEIAVSDNGPGIPADVLPKIFDPFFTTKAVGRGMGLGLFVTHEVIEEHRGCIAVETGAGGTTFRIRLPLHDPSTSAAGGSATP